MSNFTLGQIVYVPRHFHTMKSQPVFKADRARFLRAEGEMILVGFEDGHDFVVIMKLFLAKYVSASSVEAQKICAELSGGWSEVPGVRFAYLPAIPF